MKRMLIVLGCGSSGGVPRVGSDWGSCDPANPRNFRRRCSALVEQSDGGGTTRVLVDTSPDLREQALAAGLSSLDAVWYTHEHADHTHGIDELRGFFLKQRRRIPVYADAATLALLKTRFSYCFESAAGSDYPAIIDANMISVGQSLKVAGEGGEISGLPFMLRHGNISSLGFRIGGLAYTPDLNDIPEESLAALQDLDVWVVDALKRTPHPSHFHLAETLRWIERLKPRQAVLTNMHNDMDFGTLLNELPPQVKPAYDGLEIEF